MGVSSAAAAAVDCRRSFRKVEIALVVGICGAVPIIPGTKTPIYLGDVIISDGIIPYRNVRIFTNQSIQRNALHDMMAKPKRHIMALLAKLRVKSSSETLEEETRKNLEALGASDPAMRYPGIQADRLFEADYEHVESKEKCHRGGLCDDRRITRYRRGDIANPKIHIGTMASGDALMKSAKERDRIAQEKEIIGFEMEANGVWDEMPSLVIKAVNDYADSHKNDIWQRYAAASAAAAMKAFLSHWTPEDLLDETQEQGWLDI
jgi:nucleoside phosphorylase